MATIEAERDIGTTPPESALVAELGVPDDRQPATKGVLRVIDSIDDKWMMPRTPEELTKAVDQIGKTARAAFAALKKWGPPENSWREAQNASSYQVRARASEKGCGQVYDKTLVTARDRAWQKAREAKLPEIFHIGLAAGEATAWAAVSKKPNYPLSLLQLYKLGAVRITFQNVKEGSQNPQEMMLIDMPLRLGNIVVVACLAFGQTKGDQGVHYYHSRTDPCSTIRFVETGAKPARLIGEKIKAEPQST